MRCFFLAAAGVLASVLLAAGVQGEGESPSAASASSAGDYDIQIDPKVIASSRDGVLYVTVQFKLLRKKEGTVATNVGEDEIVVYEDGKPVANQKIFQPRAAKLTTVLAMDVSGSMEARSQTDPTGARKIDEAKQAARTFLDSLNPKADTGLILFDHQIEQREPPLESKDPARFAQHRQKVRELIDAARPSGGTAYLDATAEALRMVKPFPGRKAVLVMTDGVDMNSKQTLAGVIADAKAIGVPVYTLGIGERGKNEPVTTVLVLDHSGSMSGKANDTDTVSKIAALHTAASRFVDLMPSNARTTLLPFSTAVDLPQPFSANKKTLKERISRLQPKGGTLLYDATYAGIEALLAEKPRGKKAVVVMTDGKDEAPGSRRSDQVVIDRAREANIPLYMLGLGRHNEINEDVMKRMAKATGGAYYYAGNQQQLIELFEKLSIDIHDDGIDETSLRKLAEETGGKYYPARDVSRLPELFREVSSELQSTYTVTFPSRRPQHDGTARGIDVRVGNSVGSVDYNVRGVVVPDMDTKVYLVLLVLLSGLLLLPAGLRRLYRSTAGA
jgi:VWFA-related protein